MAGKRLIPGIVLLVWVLLAPVHAVEIDSYKIISQVEGTSVSEILMINLVNDGHAEITTATLTIPAGYDIQSISDTYGDLEYTVTGDRVREVTLQFTAPLEPFDERLVIFEMSSDTLVTKKEGYYEYLLVFTPRVDIPDFEHVLKFPEGARLYSPGESFDVVVPSANLTDDLGVPSIAWRTEILANEPTVFLVRYTVPEWDWKLLILVPVYIASLVIVVFLAYKVKKLQDRKKMIDSLDILNERERRVVEEVAKEEGIKQSELQERLGYTKASLSKILSKLEQRSLIRKEKSGKINRLYLGEKMG